MGFPRELLKPFCIVGLDSVIIKIFLIRLCTLNLLLRNSVNLAKSDFAPKTFCEIHILILS